jgi:hypothetical protein
MRIFLASRSQAMMREKSDAAEIDLSMAAEAVEVLEAVEAVKAAHLEMRPPGEALAGLERVDS